MHFSRILFHVAVAASISHAATIPRNHAVHEKRDFVPAKWNKRDRIEARAVLPLRVGLKQNNLHKGYDLLMDVSYPESPNYGKHYTSEQVIEMFAPSEGSVTAVKEWLIASGIAVERLTLSDNLGWFAFEATAEEAEGLLHTEFHEYEHTATGHVTAACDQYHVPTSIQEHIDYITPGIILRASSKQSSRKIKRNLQSSSRVNPQRVPISKSGVKSHTAGDTSNCDTIITPDCIAAIYHIPAATKADASNAMGIFEEGDFYAQADLNEFYSQYAPQIPSGTGPKLQAIDGAKAPVSQSSAGGESDLDFQLTYPIIYPQGTVLYQTDDSYYSGGSSSSTGFLNTFLDALDGSYCTYSAFGETGNDPIDPVYPDRHRGGYKGTLQCGVYKPANVISISYGESEADLPSYYQQRQCNEFMKLGLQGTSIMLASGDSGVAGRPGDQSDNGCLGGDSTVFSPDFPGSCPYLTVVGATKIEPGQTVNDPESAVNDPAGQPYQDAFSSGGGFSNIYPIPSYQASAVATYFKSHDPGYAYYSGGSNLGANGGIYNRQGRGYPDVAALGDNIAVVVQGQSSTSGGTSASSPIFASVINRINEERIAVGKKPVGFLNPTLYSNPSILNDIALGQNPGCGTNGFTAVAGWDPVTGLGTPNYPKMLSLFLSLP